MSEYNYHDRKFRGIENYDSGDLTREVLFHYTQDGTVVRGTYDGGRVAEGSLLAEVLADGRLDMIWRYKNIDDVIVYGTCISTPEILPDGRYRLHEVWTVTGGPDTGLSGRSVIEEVLEEEQS